MAARGNAFESRGDCAFNASGLVQKFALSAKCEANAHPKAKISNAYFDFWKFINHYRKFINRYVFNRICIGFLLKIKWFQKIL